MDTTTAPHGEAPGQRTIKLRLDTEFDTFVATGGVGAALEAIAAAVGIPPTEIILEDLRRGCVILVLTLPESQAAQLLDILSSDAAPNLAHLREQLKVVRVAEGDAVEPIELLRRSRIPFQAGLSWLHLSDLHITEDYSDTTSDTFADIDRFLTDLPRRLEEAGVEPDLIFFTGDVSQAGGEHQYSVAQTFFANLIEALPERSKSAPLFLVPGNHDVDWSAIDAAVDLELRKSLRETASPQQSLGEWQEYLGRRQAQYRRFADSIQGESVEPVVEGLAYVRAEKVGTDGPTVGIAGLNSAWLSTRKDLLARLDEADRASIADLDLQHLRLGAKQLRAAGNSASIRNAQVRIAMMHHEPMSEWYDPVDRETQRQELGRYHFVLRGHQHENCARVGAKIAGIDDYFELACGALRTSPHWYQGFMTTELDFRARLMRLRAWTVSPHARRWVVDGEFGDAGVELRPLPRGLAGEWRE